MSDLRHQSLNGTLLGVDLGHCIQYRGIRYATINERFALPVPLNDWKGKPVDCQKWGPRCPQNKYDVGHLLRVPQGESVFYDETEDEFGCVNLDVTVPSDTKAGVALPVMVWIHGGSQIISFGNGASKVGDTSKIVYESEKHSKPIIVVSVQYRLNVFHVGDGQGEKNLGFKDQQIAVQWVREHISGFGGNPANITLAGESAGAVFVHGLITSGIKVKQAIVMSGTLYMSPPRSEADTRSLLIEPVLDKVKQRGYSSLKEAPVEVLLQAHSDTKVPSVFMQQDECLLDWETKTGEIEGLMIGECEFESVLWKNGVEAMPTEQIVESFDKAGSSSRELKELYHINSQRPTQCRNGALDFMTDFVWVLSTLAVSKLFDGVSKKTYRYLFDQANPWQASSRAHHAVDLLYLFGGFDMSFNPTGEELGEEMRRRFILFVNGEAPWPSLKAFAFGPLGGCQEIDDTAVGARRRMREVQQLQLMDRSDIKAAFGSLAAGRLSLHN